MVYFKYHMRNFLKKIQLIFDRDNRNLLTIPELGNMHQDMLIIVADPKTDRMFAMYKNQIVNSKIKNVRGAKVSLIKTMLKESTFENAIDPFMGTVAEQLKAPVDRHNAFYKFIDAALFNIAKALSPKAGKTPGPEPGAVPSPLGRDRQGRISSKS